MNLFRKWLNRVAEVEEKSQGSGKEKISRARRMTMIPVHSVEFQTAEGVALPLVNLSLTGIGFLRSSRVSWPIEGDILSGTLSIQGEAMSCSVRVAHISETTVGCEFVDGKESLKNQLVSFFRVELDGTQVREVKPSALQPAENGVPHWFRSPNGSEVFLLEDGQRVIEFYLSFLGYYIESENGESVRMGRLLAEDESRGLTYTSSSELVQWVSDATLEEIQLAIRFIESIDDLSPQWKNQIQRCLEKEIID